MAATSTKKSATQAATAKAPASRASIKTKIAVEKDSGRGTVPRLRTYKVTNADTGDVLGYVNEAWKDGKMDYMKSVEEGRRALDALDAKGTKLGDNFASRARAVRAVRMNASA